MHDRSKDEQIAKFYAYVLLVCNESAIACGKLRTKHKLVQVGGNKNTIKNIQIYFPQVTKTLRKTILSSPAP
jgi:hypothetical protein